MEKETKPTADESTEVRYDSSGKKITTPPRSKETESAILAINDKMDQLLGILSSTLPTRLAGELREAAGGGAQMERLVEVASADLPDRIKKDIDQIVFEKAEMLSVVISTSIQHLQEALKSYQDSMLAAFEKLTEVQEKTNALLAELRAAAPPPPPVEEKPTAPPPSQPAQPQEPVASAPSVSQPEQKPAPQPPTPTAPPSFPKPPEEKKPEEEKPDWLKSEGKGFGWPPPPPSPESPKPPGGTS